MVSLSVEGRRGFFNMFKPGFSTGTPYMIVNAAVQWNVIFSQDYKKLLGAVTLGDTVDR